LSSNLDVLYLQGRRVTKYVVATASAPGRLIPHLTSGLTLERQVPISHGAVSAAEHHAITRTGWRRAIEPDLFDLMALVDTRRDLTAIADEAGAHEKTVVVAFSDLQQRGLVAFEDPARTGSQERAHADQ
jgi:carbamoyltransferase